MNKRRGKGWRATLALLLVAAGVTACDSSEDSLGPTAEDGALTGTVAFVKTGDGVPNLVVALFSGSSVVATTHTLPDGTFSFPDLAEGSYLARLSGFELAGLNLRSVAFDPIERPVTLGTEPVSLAFAAVGLVPPRVAGDVLCNGTAVEGATFRVIGGEDTDVTVTSDVRGRYAAGNLSQGVYTVLPQSSPCTLLPAFQVVTVGAGQAAEADFSG